MHGLTGDAQGILCSSEMVQAPASQPYFLPQLYHYAARTLAAADAPSPSPPSISHSRLKILFISATEDKVIMFDKDLSNTRHTAASYLS